ncbi:MAG: TolC family protein [Pseudolabrys sp.]
MVAWRLGACVALVASLGVVAASTAAETNKALPPVFSLYDLYAAAKTDAPAIMAAQAGANAAQYGVGDAYFGYLPRASYIQNRQREHQTVISTDNPVYQVGSGTFVNKGYTFQGLQPIVDFPAMARIAGAYAERRNQRSQFTAVQQKMTYELIEAYLLALAALDDERLARSEEETYAGHRSEIRQRLDRGMGTKTDLADIEARIAKAQSDRIAAHSSVAKAITMLQRISAQPVRGVWPLRFSFAMGSPIPSDPETWVDTGRQTNPEIRALLAQSDVADAEFKRLIGELLPRLDLVGSDQYLDAGGSLYGGGAKTDQRIVELRLTIPLFNADGRGYPQFAAGERRLQTRYAAQDRQLDIDQRIRAAYLDAVRDVRAASSLREAERNRGLVRADVSSRFRSGVAGVSDLIDAERDYVRSRRELLAAGYNYLIAMMQLKRLTGTIGEDDVRYIDGLLDRSHAYVAVSLR